MTFTCNRGHDPIMHDTWDCPLCAEMSDHADTQTRLDEAERTIANLCDVAEQCDHADVLQLLAEAEEWQKWEHAVRWKVYALDHAITRPTKTLGKQLEAIRAAYQEATAAIAKTR